MSAPVKPGDLLGGKYEVEKILGEGGMGVVVAAKHLQLDQRVAIKFMLPTGFDAEAIARFNREARAASKLRSEHVARVLDTGTFETGAPYIVMEYMEGNDLCDELLRTGPMAPQVAAEYVVQACDAIAEAHSLGIVHRDLKPANLFLTRRPDGSPLVKVLDFGISKASGAGDAGLGMTKTSTIMGSPLYMSPEQMKSAKVVDHRTDVWAIGAILFELLTHRPPFLADTLGELMAAVLSEPAPRLESVRPGLPPTIYAIVDACLVKDREHRCPNVAAIARALAPCCPARVLPIVDRIVHVVGGNAVASRVPSSPPVSPQAVTAPLVAMQTGNAWSGTLKPHPRPSALYAIPAVAAALVLAVGGVGFLKYQRSRAAPAVAAAPAPAVSSVAPEEPLPMPAPTLTTSVVVPSAEPVVAKASPPVVRPAPAVAKPSASAPAPAKPTIFDTSD
jgi:serine/threonine-protein kinase